MEKGGVTKVSATPSPIKGISDEILAKTFQILNKIKSFSRNRHSQNIKLEKYVKHKIYKISDISCEITEFGVSSVL